MIHGKSEPVTDINTVSVAGRFVKSLVMNTQNMLPSLLSDFKGLQELHVQTVRAHPVFFAPLSLLSSLRTLDVQFERVGVFDFTPHNACTLPAHSTLHQITTYKKT